MTTPSAPLGAGQQSVAPDLVEPVAFRHVVGHLASGVTVITTADDAGRYGMTASSVTSLSADPPMMLACLNDSVPSAAAVTRSRRFAVNVLGEGGGELAHRFAVPSSDKFLGVATHEGPAGLPLLSDAIAHLECEVTEQIVGGTHTVHIGRVVSASARDGQPLTYFRGGFGRFSFTRDDDAYRRARERVLQRLHAVGEVLDVDALAADLDIDAAAAFYALTRLATDGLVRRDHELGYVVTPFDAAVSDATFDARKIIELGVLAHVGEQLERGTFDEARLSAIRRHFESMSDLLVGDRFVDFDAYLDANYAFHESVVALADNAVLTATFGALSIKNVMTRSFGSTPITSRRFVDAQRGVLDGLERHDVARASEAVVDYCDLAKRRVREILAHTGGQL